MAYQPTTNYGWAMPRGGDPARINVINEHFTAKADEIVYQTRRMIAPGYIDDGSKTYQPGEIVEYENVDYVCTGTTSGAWDSSKWDATDMATQIQEAKESGGTNVEANPVEAATADLHKLKVDTTVYGIPDPAVTKTATGNPIEITDGADAPLVKCVTQITGYQSGTGTPSPDNVRPITAYTEGEIEVRGKNLFDKSSATQNYRVITLNGELEYSSGAYASDYTAVTPSTTYTMNFVYYSAANFGMAYYDANKVYISGEKQRTQEGDTSFTFTTPSNCKYIRFTIGSDVSIDNAQLEKGFAPTTYEPYTSTTHTTTYPSAIYRGSEDCVNGTVTKDWNFVDLGSLTWTKKINNVETPYFRTEISDYKYISGQANTLCSNYEKTTIGSVGSEVGYFFTSGLELRVRDIQDYTDATAFATAMSGVMLAYELATPTTSSVTPTNLPIRSLSGYSHIESTTGDMEVEYITEEYQPLVDLIQSSKHVYLTEEQVVGTWIDGKPIYEKTYLNATEQAVSYQTWTDTAISASGIDRIISLYTTRDSDGGTYVPVVTRKENGYVQIFATAGWSYNNITIQYTKTSSNNRSLSKGATDSLKADLSEVKDEGEESVDKVDKVDEPTETIEEKEENAGESNSENER